MALIRVFIRLAKKGEVWPIGDSVGTVDLEGQTWDLHIGNNGAMKVFSFVAGSELGTWEGNVKKFYNYITESHGFPADQQHLISKNPIKPALPYIIQVVRAYLANRFACDSAYQFGTEPFTGSNARFDVWYWYAEQN